MKYLILLTLIFSNVLHAQLTFYQDSPDIIWSKIEDKNFEVIFPEHLESEAQYILNLLNHYKKQVTPVYQIKPKKISLVLRSQSAIPNGFVTLTPRRTEWFMHANYSPFVGSLEWYQSLAVHEYRHVVQFDFLNRSNIKLGYYFGGETMLGTLIGLSTPNWFFEGDAVWTETFYSNGGRGRSPRFSARLKSLLTSNQKLNYDQVLAGDYTKPVPNLYVYGYFLITKGIIKYGEKFWVNVAARASDEPLNPYALTDAFFELTGIYFDDFFYQTMQELKLAWQKETELNNKKTLYQVQTSPKFDKKLYFLEKSLDTQWLLRTKKDVITEINTSPSFNKVDFKNKKFLYLQDIPNYRYGFKSYSDIFIYDLKEDSHHRITNNKRFFHPQFSPDGKKIAAIEFDSNHKWVIRILNLKGEILDSISPAQNEKFIEVDWINHENLISLTLDYRGMKKISQININDKIINDITPVTRNNLYSLFVNKNLYFEADNKGVVDIFQYEFETQRFFQCTNEKVAAYSPTTDGKNLYFSSQYANGTKIKRTSLDQCQEIKQDQLFSDYLGSGPSDNYTQSEPIAIKDFGKFYKKNETKKSYAEYSNSLTPHTWSFYSGRGFFLSGTTKNTLGTLGLTASIGVDAQENVPYGGISLSYSKYYPIFTLSLMHDERNIEILDEDIHWKEDYASLQVSLPYVFQKNLYQGNHVLSFIYDHASISEQDTILDDFELSDEQLNGQGINYFFGVYKNQLYRELLPSFGFDMNLFYEDVKTTQDENNESYIGSYIFNLYHKGFTQNHGFKWSIAGEYRPKDKTLYRLQNKYLGIINYTFSRGYLYEFTPKFNKYTLEYSLPLFYPNAGYSEWIYFNRITGTLFYDHTLSEFNEGDRTLNSYGVELNFNSMTFRKLPISYGLRLFKKEQDQSDNAEIFISI